MIDPNTIQIDLIKLEGGDRLLRLSEPRSGLALEKRIDSVQPVTLQRERLLEVFEAALERAKRFAA